MNSKRGSIGETVGMFVAVIAVIIILTVFILASGIVKVVEKTEAGIKIHNESQVDLENVISYMWDDYLKLAETRDLVSKGNSAKEALLEVKYYVK